MGSNGTAVCGASRRPLISVVIPVYNAEPWVAEAIDSALGAHQDLEVVLVEDGSADGSLAICRRAAAEHERVRLYRHAGGRNRGPGVSRNVGIRRSHGKYIAFLDADDYYLPSRFSVDVPMLEADPGIDGAYNAVSRKLEEGHVPVPGGKRELSGFAEPVGPVDLFPELLWRERGGIHANGITVRREVFERAGIFPDLPLAQDGALWLKMAASCALVGANTREPVAVHRRHAGNRATRLNPYWRQARRRSLSSVLSWAERRSVDCARVRLLRDALVDACLRSAAGRGRRGLPKAAAAVRELALACWDHPCILLRIAGRIESEIAGCLRPTGRLGRVASGPNGRPAEHI